MKIHNTTPTFFGMMEEKELTLDDLGKYYEQFPQVFTEYFPNHCPKIEERLSAALKKYPGQLAEMKKVVDQLPGIIEAMMERFADLFGEKLDLNFYILVGGYGSNAFVERKIIGDVYFAVEKLSSQPEHLEVIVAHEIGHIYHNFVSGREGIEWSKVDWEHGMTSLYREGVATYLSMETAVGHDESIYFSYNDEGEEWLRFCKENHSLVAERFLADLEEDGWNFEKEREWFRLSGGKHFGYNRLGYYLGTQFVKDYADEQVVSLWVKSDLKQLVRGWLLKQLNR